MRIVKTLRSRIRKVVSGPDVRTQHLFGDAPTCSGNDPPTVLGAVLPLASLDLHHHGEGKPDQAGECNGTDIEAIHHASKIDPASLPRKGRPKKQPRWIGRDTFKTYLDHYKLQTGLTNAQVALLIGLKPSSLHKYLYGVTHRPSLDVLERAAVLFRCRIGDLFSR